MSDEVEIELTYSAYDALEGDNLEGICELVVAAAVEHGASNGDLEFAIGDLEIALQLALGLLTPAQREEFLAEYRETAELGLEDDYDDDAE